jgi:hypothetical protein
MKSISAISLTKGVKLFDMGADGLAFDIKVKGQTLTVVASNGAGWDHISVSTPTRTPTWEEMCAIKDICFNDDECVVQYHPPKSQYVNNHPYCLHIWKQQGVAMPLPPSLLVGIKGVEFGSPTGGRR